MLALKNVSIAAEEGRELGGLIIIVFQMSISTWMTGEPFIEALFFSQKCNFHVFPTRKKRSNRWRWLGKGALHALNLVSDET